MVIQRADRKDSKLRCQNVQFRNSEENQTSYPQNKVFYTNVVRRYAFLVGYNAWRFSPILVPRARDPSGLWLGSQSIRFVSHSRFALDPNHRPEGPWALGTGMFFARFGSYGTIFLVAFQGNSACVIRSVAKQV